MTNKTLGIHGQASYDEFLCLTDKCRDRKQSRKSARQARQDAREAEQERKRAHRVRQQQLRLEKKELKNDALRSDNERNRVETQTIQQVVQTPPPASPPVATATVAGIPQWMILAGAGVLVLLLVISKK